MLICCYQKGESMNKVIKIEGENIYIGLDDGSILEAKKTDFNYSPNLNLPEWGNNDYIKSHGSI